ncbi:hypothetical protein [Leptolyngbya sp. AN02str]|uniref:hypothetical protein n=1 Tax=Leptolyngbya sp. AN02str TaxID=3423363 RepID=UPI003D3149A6
MKLHKALLNSERHAYEQFHGPIKTTGEYFQLVVGHEWFEWLRPMSQFIVQMDDVLQSKEPVADERVMELLAEAEQLLQPAEYGTVLERGYYRAIQRDPDIAVMHADISLLFKKHK